MKKITLTKFPLVLVILSFGTVGGFAPSAGATTCIVHPDAVSKSIVDGSWDVEKSEPGSTDFLDFYDFAFTGTITEIEETENGVAIPVHFDVINGFGVDTIEEQIVIINPDDGGQFGYRFEAGRTYFVPVKAREFLGEESNSVFGCDPIDKISPQQAADLVEVSTMTVATVGSVPKDSGLTTEPFSTWSILGAAALVLAGLGLGLVLKNLDKPNDRDKPNQSV